MEKESDDIQPVLRPARPEDSKFVFQVKKDALGEYVRQTWGWDEEFQRAFHAKDYNPATTQIISWKGADVGWVELATESGEMRLAAIYILGEYRNRGIGSTVIKGIMGDAMKRQLPMTLQVLKANARAQALYERMGFVVSGESGTHKLMRFRS